VGKKSDLVNVEDLVKEKHNYLREKEDYLLNRELELKVKALQLDKMKRVFKKTYNNF